MVKTKSQTKKHKPKLFSRRRRLGPTRKKKALVYCIGCEKSFQPYQLAGHEQRCEKFWCVYHGDEDHLSPAAQARIAKLKSLIKPHKELDKNREEPPILRCPPRSISGEKLRGPHG